MFGCARKYIVFNTPRQAFTYVLYMYTYMLFRSYMNRTRHHRFRFRLQILDPFMPRSMVFQNSIE